MMRSSMWVLMAMTGLASACGGTTTLPLDGDGGMDASSDAVSEGGGDAGSCVPSPVTGTACKVGDVSCDKVNACCAPSYACSPQSKTWEALAVGCACIGFTCGDKTCAGTQICVVRGSGVLVPDGGKSTFYECAEYPAACARQWTCDCLKKNIGPSCMLSPAGGCDESKGHPTLTCMSQ